MSTDILGISTSALLAYQRALNTTGHNISNVNTEGYHRQQVSFGTNDPFHKGNGWYGTGVNVTGVQRSYNELLEEQVRIHSTLASRSDSYYGYASQINNILADDTVGLSSAMDEFFASVEGVANDPSSIPAREVLLAAGESLSDKFHYLDQRMSDVQSRVNADIEVSVAQINELGSAIARVNADIAYAIGSSGGNMPNDLLDQRDALLADLSELVQVQVVTNTDNTVNVFVGSGQGLVVGSSVANLSVTTNEYSSERRDIYISGNGATQVKIGDAITGGTLGGALDFQQDVLNPARNSLGQIAATLALNFNEQHHTGVDLNNAVGDDFFSAPTPTVEGRAANAAGGMPTVAYDEDNLSALTADDYELTFDGANWSLTDYSDGSAVAFGSGTSTSADPWLVNGLEIAVDGIVGAAAGDRFLIRPVGKAAGDIGMTLQDPSRVAAANGLTVGEATNASGAPVNTGTGVVDRLSLSRTSGFAVGNEMLPLGGDITLTYDGAGNYTLALPGGLAATPASIAYNPATDDGVTRTFSVDDGTNSIDISFRVTGVPAAGDQFVITDSVDVSANNGNMASLAALANADTMNGGTASYHDSYGQLVADVGSRTRRAEITKDAEATLKEQAVEARDNVSGVNLDEEAANLIRFQQAYQANARVVATANQLFDSLLNAVG